MLAPFHLTGAPGSQETTMLSLPSPIAGPRRRLCAGLLALTAALAFGACGTEDSFAPADGTAPSDAPAGADAELDAATPAPATVGLPRILFTSYRKGHQNLYSMDPSGANVFPLATGYNTEPSW